MKKSFSFLPHLPLGLVIAAGGLVMGLSEEPAARALDSVSVGSIKPFNSVARVDSLSISADAALMRAQSGAQTATQSASRVASDSNERIIGLENTSRPTSVSLAGPSPTLAFLDPSVVGFRLTTPSDIEPDGVVDPDSLSRGMPGFYSLTGSTLYSDQDPPFDLIELALELSPVLLVGQQEQAQNIARWLSRYYRKDAANVVQYVRYALQSGRRNGVDPMLIMAVMSIESSLNPKARSHKDARGLMQVLVRVHTDKFKYLGGTKAAYDPRVSVEVGTRILKRMIKRTGSVEKALKHYVGAANLRSDRGYGAKVIRQRDRIWAAAHGLTIPFKPNLKTAIRRVNLAQLGVASRLVTALR